MGWILAILGSLAAAAAAAWLRSRRPALRAAGGDSASPLPARAPASDPGAGSPGEGDWVSRITQTLPSAVRRFAEPDPSGPDIGRELGLQGNLAQTPLHDLLQYLSLGRKSGVLELASGRRTGRIVLAEGRIGRTSYRGKEGMEAAFLMLDLPQGDFEFYEQPRPADGSPSTEAVDVIMLWMARKPKKQQPT